MGSSAYAVQVRFQASDLSLFPTDPMTSGKPMSITPTPSLPPKTSQPAETSQTADSPTGGLPLGAKIGMGVGIPAGLILLALLGAFLLIRGRKTSRQHGANPEATPEMDITQSHPEQPGGGFRLAPYTTNFSQQTHEYTPQPPQTGKAPTVDTTNADRYSHTSTLVSPVSPSDMDKASRIQQEQARLEERRQRLLRLEQIEEEQERLRQQADRLRANELD